MVFYPIDNGESREGFRQVKTNNSNDLHGFKNKTFEKGNSFSLPFTVSKILIDFKIYPFMQCYLLNISYVSVTV